MVSVRIILYFNLGIVFVSACWAQSGDNRRLSGFREHIKTQSQYNEIRIKAEGAYFEEQELWEQKKKRDLGDYKQQKKDSIISDAGPEAKEDAAEKRKLADEYEKNRLEFKRLKAQRKKEVQESANLPTEFEELGLNITAPRYKYQNRELFGATRKYGRSRSGGGSSAGAPSYGGGSSGGSSPSFPAPPTFDDFGDGGYVPAPNSSDDFGDIPPPPPPPPMQDDFGGDRFSNPPPPVFDPGDF